MGQSMLSIMIVLAMLYVSMSNVVAAEQFRIGISRPEDKLVYKMFFKNMNSTGGAIFLHFTEFMKSTNYMKQCLTMLYAKEGLLDFCHFEATTSTVEHLLTLSLVDMTMSTQLTKSVNLITLPLLSVRSGLFVVVPKPKTLLNISNSEKSIKVIETDNRNNKDVYIWQNEVVVAASYFLRVFHTSVWSLIFLMTLISASLLFVFERSHPFDTQFHRQLEKLSTDQLGLVDCYYLMIAALFLQSYNKSPCSPAGRVIVLFWYAFSLVCLVTYAVACARRLTSRNGSTDNLLWPSSSLSSSVSPQLSNSNIDQFWPLSANGPISIQNGPTLRLVCQKGAIVCDVFKLHHYEHLRPESVADVEGLIQSWLVNNSIPSNTVLLLDTVQANYLATQMPGQLALAFLQNVDVPSVNMVVDKTSSWQAESYVKNAKVINTALDYPLFQVTLIAANANRKLQVDQVYRNHYLTGRLDNINKLYRIPRKAKLVDANTTDTMGMFTVRLYFMHGPLLLSVVGCFAALLTHMIEFVYLSFIKKPTVKSRRIHVEEKIKDSESEYINSSTEF